MTEPPPAPSPDFEPVIGESIELVRQARQQGVELRLIGSLGVRMHCLDAQQVQDRFERPVKDIDLVCRRGDRQQLRRFMEARGYDCDRDVLVAMEGERYLFRHPGLGVELDVFADPLDFCHKVKIGARFNEHPLSIPLDRLVLHKLQIVELTRGDYVDLFTLFLAHSLDDDDSEQISPSAVAEVLSSDWGFHRTATENLDRLVSATAAPASELPVLRDEEVSVITDRVTALREAIDAHPKSLGWKMRAKVGERVQWWQDVDVPRESY